VNTPWALTSYDFGSHQYIFLDIFRNNSLKNGLIPIAVDEETHKMLFELVEEIPNAEFTVDLNHKPFPFPMAL
jgi:3-isopropylmalate/(R)-2-methylmalate dehydratase small subunit